MSEETVNFAESAEPAPKPKAVRRGRPRKTPASEEESAPKVEQKELKLEKEEKVEKAEKVEQAAEGPKEEKSEAKNERSGDNNRSGGNRGKGNQGNRQGRQGKGQNRGGGQQQQGKGHQKQKNAKQQGQKKKVRMSPGYDPMGGLVLGSLAGAEFWADEEAMGEMRKRFKPSKKSISMNAAYTLSVQDLVGHLDEMKVEHGGVPRRTDLLKSLFKHAREGELAMEAEGIVEIMDQGAFVTFAHDNYAIKEFSPYIHASIVKAYGLLKGHEVKISLHPPREDGGESCPFALEVLEVMGEDPKKVLERVPFEELVPYYPTERLFLETHDRVEWDNLSMRVVDLLTPIGLGQRGLIVAPPRTGKTMLMQSMAHAIAVNKPEAHLMVLLVDERPEEVTDFKRQVTNGEVISSTFDQTADSHVHTAEMVVERARRMVEVGKDVIIILDSITRLARAYNTTSPSSGKILSGGVEANSLQMPKRFFGSARNIEGGGSLTILGTALVETGSRMDEVIFEEFKGTGNMEINLDRELVSKRIFPAIAMDRSGTRKEELLYHPDEIEKIYALRRAMKGLPSTEAVEMLIQRVKKTKCNVDFLMNLSR